MAQSNKRTPDLSQASPSHPKPISEFIDDLLDNLPGDHRVYFEADKDFKQQLLKRIEEEVTAARVDELKQLKAIDAFNEPYTLDPRPAKIVTNRLAALHHKDSEQEEDNSNVDL